MITRVGVHISCTFAILGGVRAELDGDDVALPGQLRTLLGILLADRDVAVPTDVIVERLWPGDAPRTAVKGVQVLAGRLRRALEPGLADAASSRLIVTTVDGYRLAPGETDLDRYEVAAELARRSEDPCPGSRPPRRPSGRGPAVRGATRPTRGGWRRGSRASRSGIATSRRSGPSWCCARVASRGRSPTLQDLASAQPLREQRWAHLMTGLYRSGRQADTLRAYDEARGHLREELGLEPGPSSDGSRSPCSSTIPRWHSCPRGRPYHTEPTSFVGRDAELAHLGRAVDRDRVVTVVGLGGMGKTRLVDEFAHRRRRDGHRVLRASMGATADPTPRQPARRRSAGALHGRRRIAARRDHRGDRRRAHAARARRRRALHGRGGEPRAAAARPPPRAAHRGDVAGRARHRGGADGPDRPAPVARRRAGLRGNGSGAHGAARRPRRRGARSRHGRAAAHLVCPRRGSAAPDRARGTHVRGRPAGPRRRGPIPPRHRTTS